MLRENKLLTLIIILCIAIRLLFFEFPFWGLEYEDSFIYNDSARLLGYSHDLQNNPFKTQSCIDGTFLNCYQHVSFGGHLITFPFIIHLWTKIFTYNYLNIFFVNFLFSILLVFSVIKWNKLRKKKINILIFISLLVITPYVSIFHTSGLAETSSSYFVTLFLISFISLNEKSFKINSITYWICLFALISSILIKRENFLLYLPIITIPLYRYYKREEILPNQYLFFLFKTTLFISYFFLFIGLLGIEENEAGDIGKSTFSFNYFILNIKEWLIAIFTFSYWGFTGIILMISLLISIYNKELTFIGFLSLSLSLGFLILYSSHYRSYYQVNYGLTHPFETLRYSVNYFPLLAIYISSVNLDKFSIHLQKRYIYILQICMIIISSYQTIKTRILLWEDEQISRIEPVLETLKVTNNHDIIITEIPIIFHTFSGEDQHIVDAFFITEERLIELQKLYPKSKIYFLKPRTENIDKERFNFNFNYSKFQSINYNSDIYDLLLMK